MPTAKVGVIGGTGLYDIEGLSDVAEVDVDTPFGKPSDSIVTGQLSGVGVAFLPRHGRGHRIMPTEVPSRANIWALKSLGVEHIIAINSVGSFKEEVKPGHLLIPDQLIDRTRQRVNTFFGGGIVAHIQFAEPFCARLCQTLYECAQEAGAGVHQRGTYVVMEGPAFSTRAESILHRSWGVDVIGMTALPEAKLAREAEICYSIIACATDYDAWHETEAAVSVDMILSTLKANIGLSKEIIRPGAAPAQMRWRTPSSPHSSWRRRSNRRSSAC
jgi:5'-methylthioadenosine phosphorylase